MLLLSGSPTKHSNELMIKSSPTISLAFPSDRVDNKNGNNLGNATSNGEKIGWILTLVCFNFSAAYLLLLLLLLYCSTALLLHYSTAPLLLYCSTAPLLVLLLQSTGRDAAGAGEEASQVSAPHGFTPACFQTRFAKQFQISSTLCSDTRSVIPHQVEFHTSTQNDFKPNVFSIFGKEGQARQRDTRPVPSGFTLAGEYIEPALSEINHNIGAGALPFMLLHHSTLLVLSHITQQRPQPGQPGSEC